MALQHSQYTAPDKVPGDFFSSEEHNELKGVTNQKADINKTIVIEGDQSIDGILTVNALVTTSIGNASGPLAITAAKDHITFISGTNTVLIGAEAAENRDFYIIDSRGREVLYVETVSGNLFLGRVSIDSGLGSESLVIDSKTNTIHQADITFKRSGTVSNQLISTINADLHFTVQGTDGIIKQRIIAGSGKFGGSPYSVALYEGNSSRLVFHTTSLGASIPAISNAGSIVTGTGLQLLNQTSFGSAGRPEFVSSSIFFKETLSGSYGFAIDNEGSLGTGTAVHTLTFNRYFGSTTPQPIMKMAGASSNVEFYGDILVNLTSGGLNPKAFPLFTGAGYVDAKATGMVALSGHLVIGGGSELPNVLYMERQVEPKVTVCSDNDVVFYSNLTAGYANRKEMTFRFNGDLSVPGRVYAIDFLYSSDAGLKEDIQQLPDVDLDIEFKTFKFKGSKKQRYGVVAQDVQKVMPGLVTNDANGDLAVSMVDLLILKVAELDRKLKKLML